MTGAGGKKKALPKRALHRDNLPVKRRCDFLKSDFCLMFHRAENPVKKILSEKREVNIFAHP